MTEHSYAPDGAAAPFEVLAVRYGSLTTTRSSLFASYGVYGEPDDQIVMDYYFWVARNAERTVLIDTGFDSEVGQRRGRTVTSAPAEALSRLGIDPAAVDDVVLTHFHYDHIGNVGLFPRARFIASRREWAFWTGPVGRQPAVAAPVESAEVERLIAAHGEGRLAMVSDQPLGIPGIRIVELEGHTPGQLGVAVDTEAGAVVLASDAAHFYEEYEREMPFHVYSDIERMYGSFQTLQRLAAAPRTVVVPGHDPETMQRFPAAGPGLEGLAVRIG